MEIKSLTKKKVAIIGGGFVGASIAYALSIRNTANEIVIIDIPQARERVEGEAMDIQHGIPAYGNAFVRAGDYSDCADADLIVITAGRPRKDGETRLDLAKGNVQILTSIVNCIKEYYTNAVILLVANPVDVLVQKCAEMMGIENGKIFGAGTNLDSSRLVAALCNYTGLKNNYIKANMLGEHGESMFAGWSTATVNGMPIDDYMKSVNLPWNDEIKAQIEKDVISKGAQIIKAKGKTHYGIATSVCYIADAVLNQVPTVVPVASPFHGEYGINGVSISVPSVVSGQGVEARLECKFSDAEMDKLLKSAATLKAMIDSL